jgi:hypothetical protein
MPAPGTSRQAGAEDLRGDIQEEFLQPVADHVGALETIVREFRPDVVETEHTLVG